MKKILFFTFCLALCVPNMFAQKKNEIKKVFHHQVHQNDHGSFIELGKLSFYFESQPDVEVSRTVQNSVVSHQFFFPNADVKSSDVRNGMAKINKDSPAQYQLKVGIEQRQGQQGVAVSISYNEDAVGLSYDHFESIKKQKGVVFRILNKRLLKDLSKRPAPIIRMAARTGPTCVVIDCGHGGDDPGTSSATHVTEKEITLQIGSSLARFLVEQGIEVTLTRDKDIFVPLDVRTTCANEKRNRLLVSLHTNGCANKAASGFETFCLGKGLVTTEFCTIQDSELSNTCARSLAMRLDQSEELARCVHHHALESARKYGYHVVDRQVKRSVSQILIGATIPTVLVELGFLSNPLEAERLQSSCYQTLIAQGIGNGILAYLRKSSF